VFNVKSASWAAATDARCPTDSTTRALLARSPAQLIKAITSALVNLPLFRPGSDVSRRLPGRRRRRPTDSRSEIHPRAAPVASPTVAAFPAARYRPSARAYSLAGFCLPANSCAGEEAAAPAIFHRAFWSGFDPAAEDFALRSENCRLYISLCYFCVLLYLARGPD